ncbi:MAG: amidohydrolase [Eudoraea sp.]|nr:amidohydrolase [Eudoraea sp.]
MQTKIFVFSLFFLACITGIGQEMSFESYNPASTLVVPGKEVPRAKFPFVDIHSHQFRMATQDLSALIADMDKLNLAVMVNLSGRSGEQLAQAVDNVSRNYPNRFVVFANIDFKDIGTPGWTENTVRQLETDVKNGAKGLKIYKSLGLRHRDSEGNRVTVDDKRLDPIWAKCGELGIPVLIHSADPKSFWDPMDSNNERWLELKTRPGRKRSDNDPAAWQQIIDEQHRMFKKHPNTRFINAHMGWYANNLGKLAALMDEIPNMYVGIGAVIAELGRQPRFARDFFIRYQDRILFGKDSWQPNEFPTYFRVLETNDEYFPYYKKYHAFWAMYGLGLPDEVLRKVYYKNAMKLLPGLDKALFPEE